MTQPQPAPKPAKSRLFQDGRDMFWSLAPLVIACIVLAGMAGMCSFQPTGTGRGPTPTFDAAAALRADAAALPIPVRLPQLPAGWHSNSGQRGSIEDGRTDPATGQRVRAVTSTVGYLTPTGMYLSLTQSNADEDRLVASIPVDRSGPASAERFPTGTENVDGTAWVVYRGGEGTEPVWTTRLTGPTGPAQIATTGAGDQTEFRTLAAATQSQPPLTARR
jgi:Protein of unknown function (DUF4245)